MKHIVSLFVPYVFTFGYSFYSTNLRQTLHGEWMHFYFFVSISLFHFSWRLFVTKIMKFHIRSPSLHFTLNTYTAGLFDGMNKIWKCMWLKNQITKNFQFRSLVNDENVHRWNVDTHHLMQQFTLVISLTLYYCIWNQFNHLPISNDFVKLWHKWMWAIKACFFLFRILSHHKWKYQ